MNILVAKNGSQLGPFSEADVRTKLSSGEFAPTDFGWKEGMAAWSPLSEMLGAAPAPVAPPPQYYAPQPQSAPVGSAPQPQSFAAQPYSQQPGQYSSPQTYNSPYPAQYQPGAQPWGAPGAFAYAGFWRRVAAYVLDVIIVYIPFLVVFGVLAAAFGGHTSPEDENTALGVVFVLFYLMYLCGVVFYFIYLESSGYQATYGKMALGIKVIDLNGNRISFGKSTGRFFSKFLSSFFFGIGYMMAGFTERKQALHDMIVSTLVVKK